jgi:hypothetical protein
MFFRFKKSGERSYVQIVENKRIDGAVRQSVSVGLQSLTEAIDTTTPAAASFSTCSARSPSSNAISFASARAPVSRSPLLAAGAADESR